MNMQLGIPLNSLDDNKGTFFYIFYFFPFFFLSFFARSRIVIFVTYVQAWEAMGNVFRHVSTR